MLLYLTMIVILANISIIAISRKSIEVKEAMNQQIISVNQVHDNNPELNEAETTVLFFLGHTPEITNSSSKDYKYLSVIYYENLKKYLCRTDVSLSMENALEIEKLIQGNNEVLLLETETDINKMSYDGRKLLIYIYQEIYEHCGLTIAFGADNEIVKITDHSGQIIYQDKGTQVQLEFNKNALVITLSIILILITLCFLIAKKNQLFVKGGKYDGFDEKEYA